MHMRRLDRGTLTRKYGIDAELLLPWDALNAPFRGAWCILRQATESTPHAHPDYEIFIAMKGSAALVVDGERRPFVAGDIAHMRPGSTHHLVNDGPADFEYYAIWWDEEMTAQFAARHEREPAGG